MSRADDTVVNSGTSGTFTNIGYVPDEVIQEKQSQPGLTPVQQGQYVSTGGKDGAEPRENILLPIDKASAETDSKDVKTYKRRWLMLTIFCIYSFSNSYQWIHLNIIANVMLRYYNESLPGDSFQQEMAVDWLSLVFMLAYIPLIFPATWLMDRKGLRPCLLLGNFLNVLGAWLKCASVSPDRFWMLMIAQTICAIAQLWVLETPPRLAAVWFGPSEVSTATSLGVFGNQVGAAAGFLIPPQLVPNSDSLDQIGRDISVMFYIGGGVTTAIFLITIVAYKNVPPNPPSRAQVVAQGHREELSYVSGLIRLMKNKGFVLLFISYGVNTGCYYAIATLLNIEILNYFQNAEKEAGQVGLTIVLTGIVGAILGGIWLDKTRSFKGTSLGIYACTFVGMVIFTFTMNLGYIWIVFLTAGALGFFMTGYLPVGFEFAAELTFPENEGISSGLLNASAQTFGIIMTLGMRAMMNRVNVMWANVVVCGALLLGTIMTAVIPADYRRQAAGKDICDAELEVEKAKKNLP